MHSPGCSLSSLELPLQLSRFLRRHHRLQQPPDCGKASVASNWSFFCSTSSSRFISACCRSLSLPTTRSVRWSISRCTRFIVARSGARMLSRYVWDGVQWRLSPWPQSQLLQPWPAMTPKPRKPEPLTPKCFATFGLLAWQPQSSKSLWGQGNAIYYR